MKLSLSPLLLLLAAGVPRLGAAVWYNLADNIPGANDWNGDLSWWPSAPPDAPGQTANFSTNNYAVTNEVFLNGTRTIGILMLGDTTAPIVQTILSSGMPGGGSLVFDNSGQGAQITTLVSSSSPPVNQEFPVPKAASEMDVPVVLADNLTLLINTAPSSAALTRWPGVNFRKPVTETGAARQIVLDGNVRCMVVFAGGSSHTGGTLVKRGTLTSNGAGSFGTGPITVQSGAQVAFSGSTARTVGNSLSIAGNGVAEPAGDRGALFFPQGEVTMTGGISLSAASRIEGTASSDTRLNGPLTGTASLEFNALTQSLPATAPRTGDFTLTGNASAFTGKITVSRGNFTLGPNASPGGAMDVSKSATLRGETNIAGTLRLGTASPDAANTLLFTDPLTPGALRTGGNLELLGVTKVHLTALPPGPVVKVLAYGGSLTGSAVNLDLTGGMALYRPGTAFDVTTSPGEVLLNVVRGSLVWNAGTAIWDTSGTTWTGGDTFHYLDDVTFDDTSPAGGLVTISGDLQAGVIRVNNSAPFTFDAHSGDSTANLHNAIISGSFIKDGSGPLTIGVTNASAYNRHIFNGGCTINSGEVKVFQNGDAALTYGPLGTGPITMNGGSLTHGSTLPLSLYNDVTLNAGVTLGGDGALGPFRIAGRITLGADAVLHIPSTVTLGKGGDLSTGVGDSGAGRSLTKTGGGLLELANGTVSTWGGPTAVQAGTLRVRGGLTCGPVTLSPGATLSGDGTVTAPSVIVPAGAVITAANDSTNLFAVNFTLTGNVKLDGAYDCDIEQSASDRLTVTGNLDITDASLRLHTIEPPKAAAYIIVRCGSISGASFASVTGIPAGYRLIYGYNDGTGTNNIALVAIPPFELWTSARGLTAGVNDAPGDDPNHDGVTNLAHFAFDSNPLGTGSDEGKIRQTLASAGGTEQYLTITLPVRLNTALNGTPLQGTKDGLVLQIRGAATTGPPWSLPVIEVIPPATSGMPALGDYDLTTGPDWEYRTFRLLQPQSALPRAFLSAGAEAAP